MCMYLIGNKKPQVASGPITVYKILTAENTGPYYKNHTYSPGLNLPDETPETDVTATMASKDGIDMVDKPIYVLGAGYLFAFKEKRYAMEHLVDLINFDDYYNADNVRVEEMEVPAGVEYYESGNQIAARALEWKCKEAYV